MFKSDCCANKEYVTKVDLVLARCNCEYVSVIKIDHALLFTSSLIRALLPYHSHLLLLLTHVVIVVNLCCVEGLMEDRCTSNKHSR